ncbi:unnamed protein product [Durusdinium trenchii]|uniref:Uncharacterized protein n=1 Tax=Durusdinium trenchii TaxID=1381693 RepID=A0ABP0RYE8_9DINO
MDTVQSLREGVLQVEKFANLEDVRSRADRHGSKLNGVKESMMSLVHSVQSEIKERVDANKALNAMFESQVQAIQDRLEFVFMKKLDRLDHSVAAISQRMSVVERDFALTREKHMQDMLRRNQHLAQDAEKFMSALRSERADRQHRADGFARQLSDYEAKTRTFISSQMQMREQQTRRKRASKRTCPFSTLIVKEDLQMLRTP